jgi:hypothetical protein
MGVYRLIDSAGNHLAYRSTPTRRPPPPSTAKGRALARDAAGAATPIAPPEEPTPPISAATQTAITADNPPPAPPPAPPAAVERPWLRFGTADQLETATHNHDGTKASIMRELAQRSSRIRTKHRLDPFS